MAKNYTDNQLTDLFDKAICKLTNFFESNRHSNDIALKSKAGMLADWIPKYTRYIKKEKGFKYHNLPEYRYGEIIYVDFGFRIGAELGGPHYAVVINKKCQKFRQTVTVVPLGSLKNNFKESPYKIKLEDGIYKSISDRLLLFYLSLDNLTEDLLTIKNKIDTGQLADNVETLGADVKNKISAANTLAEACFKLVNNLEHMKNGSVAHIGQITTISKIRILDPTDPQDISFGAKLSLNDMQKIENAIKNLFIQNF